MLDGRYRVVRKLGAGSMGDVYLAEHGPAKRRVAIQFLRPELMSAAEVLEDFIAEARAAGTLGHRNIAACIDTGSTGARVPYLVLEDLEGKVLAEEIHRLGGLPIHRALDIADQIAAAIAAAHDADIVHRSLTSDNVFLVEGEGARDVVKVADFGMARLFGVPDGSPGGVASGRPEFMSPEQLADPEAADRRTDVYALGVILHEMLAGRRPFSDDDRPSLLHRVAYEPPPPLGRPDAPAGLEQLIASRLLAKDPAQRCASMAQVRSALDRFAMAAPRSEPAAAEPRAVRRAASAPPRPEPASPAETVALPALAGRRAPRLVWLIAAVLVAGAGGGVMYIEDQTRAAAERLAAAVLDGDAEKLAGAIDTEVRAAHLRADGVAATPMLRAAIETDAATLENMAGSDFLFSPRPGEVLEVFQLRGGAAASLLRIPAHGAAIPPVLGNRTRIASDGDRITIAASAPIARRDGAIGGAVAISAPVDLAPIEKRLADHAQAAALLGLGAPLALAGAAGAAGAAPSIAIRVPLGADLETGEITLTAVVAPPPVPPELRIAGPACWGLAGVLLALFAASLFRGRAGA